MNRIYRLVFNRALGVMQVASELAQPAQGTGGGAGGQLTAALRSISFSLWVALGWVGLAAGVSAQQAPTATPAPQGESSGRIVADPGARPNQRPTVVTAPNGVPLVNITTPSAAGVSRNTYSQFDVGTQGAILNNSRTNTQTQLGGWVQGNPWLATGTAKVILNEINSANPSYLNGYVEVAGSRAEVVIANPAGIQVDGGGFLNASRVTLTTGTPVFNGGSLDHYRVVGGVIGIGGAGLDNSRVDYTDLITRSLQVNAGVWAQHLQASLGTNAVSADHSQVVASNTGDAAPAYGLDVGALGGMYAGKIFLMGTESGVGVRNAGAIGAQAGDLVVTVDGRLENTGSLQSQQNTQLSASGGVANAGMVSAARELTIDTPQDVDNSGGTLNAMRIEVNAASLRNREGAIEQTGVQALALNAGALSNREGGRIGEIGLDPGTGTPGGNGQPGTGTGNGSGGNGGTDNGGGTPTTPPITPLADGALNISGTLDNDGGRISAGGGIALHTDNGLNNDGGQLGLRDLTVSAGDVSNQAGTLNVLGSATLDVGTLNNDAGTFNIQEDLTLEAERFSNRGGHLNHAGDANTSLNVTGLLDNTDGTLASNARQLEVRAGHLVNEGGTVSQAGTGGLTLTTGKLDGNQGTIATAGALTLTATDIAHRQAVISATQLTVNANRLDNTSGQIIATGTGANTLALTQSLDNSSGTIASNGDLSINTTTFTNAQGMVQQAGTGELDIEAVTLNGEGGTLISNGGLTITGQTTDLRYGTTSAKRISIDTGDLTTAGGQLTATGTDVLSLQVRNTLDNRGGTLASNGAVALSAQALHNQQGTVIAAGAAPSTFSVAGTLDNRSGVLSSRGDVAIQAGELRNAAGTVLAAETSRLQVSVDGLLDNSSGGRLAAGGDLALAAQTLDNREGNIEQAGEGELSIEVETLQGQGGSISSNGALSLTGGDVDLRGGTTRASRIELVAESLTTADGTLASTGSDPLSLQVREGLNNDGGTIAANGALDLSAGSLSNREGVVSSAGTAATQVAVTGLLDNTDGTLASNAQQLEIRAGHLVNERGTVSQAGTEGLTLTTGTLDGNEGTIATAGALSLTATDIAHRQAVISATQLTVNANRLDNNAGQIIGTGTGANTLTLTESLDNTSGTLASNGDLSISTETFTNTQGVVQQAGAGELDIEADTLNGEGGTLISNGGLTISGQTTNLRDGTTSAKRIAIDTGDLTTAGGQLTATGTDTLSLQVRNTLDNSSGTLASNGAVDLSATTFNNASGVLQAAGAGDNTIRVAGELDNRAGKLLTAGHAQVSASTLANQGGVLQVAGSSDLVLDVNGLLDNREEGVIASGGDLQLNAGEVDNRSGVLGAGGAMDLVSATGIDNASGIVQATQALHLSSDRLVNTAGTIIGAQVQIDTRGGELDNSGGTLASVGGNLDIDSGVLNNTAGRIQSSGDLRLDTAGQTLTNQQSGADGGILSAGQLQISSGALANQAGVVFAQGDANLTATTIDNAEAGLLGSATNLTVQGTTLNNAGGAVQAGHDASLVISGALDNQAGLVAAGQALSITASSVDNRNTLSASNTALGLQATQLQLTAGSLDNRQGQVIADASSTLTLSGLLDNAAGQVSSGGALDISADAVTNTAGTLLSGGDQTLTARSLSGDGKVLSQGDATLTLQEDLINSGEMSANGTLSLSTAGDLSNQGTLQAGNLHVQAANIDNAATGELTSVGLTHLSADGTLTNRGLIDGAITHIEAGLLDNVGSGRLYGDHVAIEAGALRNQEETIGTVTTSATIAARQQLDIGVGTLTNSGQGLIYSDGNAAIGGALDTDRLATGTASVINNLSATIEVSGDLAIQSQAINNVRENVVITQTTVTKAPVRLDQPVWRNNGANATSNIRTTSNYSANEVYYLSPEDVLEDTPYITPDGFTLRRAVVRLTPQTTAYFFGRGGLHRALGERSRLDVETGTVTLYYFSRQDNQVNPDQVSAGADNPFAEISVIEPGSPAFSYVDDSLTYSNAYGTCTTNCVQLIAQYQHDDPDHVLMNPRGTGGGGLGDNEQYRIATQTVTEDVLAAGAGAEAIIHAGGTMRLSTDALVNRYGRIAAGGNLVIEGLTGAASVVNVGQTLYRTYDFSNVTHAYNGSTRAWSNPAISEEVEQVGGAITSGGTLVVDVGDLSNLDEGRDAPNVQDGSALANLTVHGVGSGPTGPGGTTITTLGAQAGQSANAASIEGPDAATGDGGGTIGEVGGSGQVGGTTATSTTGQTPDNVATGTLNTQLPTSSLFTVGSNNGSYLIETDPRFANYRNWLGSDYLLSQLGFDPANVHKRLGDGYYEQKLVREQIGQLTGRRFLTGYSSDEDQFRALMNAGALFAQQFGLRPGVALSAEQMAQLTSDIVWLVEQTVTLADGSTATVLVPQVYLRLQPGDLQPNGVLLAGANVNLKLSGNLLNTGDIAGRQVVSINAANINNLAGGAISGQAVGLQATHDINVIGSTVTASDVLNVQAGGNVTVASTTQTVQGGGFHQYDNTNLNRVAGLYVTNPGGLGVLNVNAGGDVTLQAAQIVNAGTNGVTRLAAGGDLNLTTLTTSRSSDTTFDDKNYHRTSSTTQVGTTVQGAGNVILQAGNDVNLTAANLSAGNALAVVAGNDINSLAAVDSASVETSQTARKWSMQASTTDETVKGTQFSAGGNIALQAVNDISLQAATVVSEQGGIALAAGRDVNLTAASETHSIEVDETKKKSGFLNSKTTTTHDKVVDDIAIGTVLSGETVAIAAGRDVTVQGAQIVGTGDVTVAAGRDLTLEATESTHSETHNQTVKKSGLMGTGGVGIMLGSQSQAQGMTVNSTTAEGTLLGSLEGKVTLVAGEDVKIRGSDVISATGTDIVGKTVTIESAQETMQEINTTQMKSSGIELSLSGTAVNAAMGAYYGVKRASETDNDRLAALNLAAAAYAGKDAHGYATGQSVAGSTPGAAINTGDVGSNFNTGQMGSPQNDPVNLKLGIMASSASSETVVEQTTQRGSAIKSGGDVNVITTEGDLTVTGSTISGQNVLLDSARDLILQSAEETLSQHSTNKAGGGGVGVLIGQSGFGFYVEGSAARGKADGDDVSHAETLINASDTLTLKSGGNTTLQGAQVAGETVKANIGGDLTLISEQDTSVYKSKDQSASGQAVIGYSSSFSASYNQTKVDSDYASVTQQTGIQAGKGGFDLQVGGGTTLEGAAITSTATADKNRLSTDSLTVTDLQNKADYEASSVGVSVSSSWTSSAIGTGLAMAPALLVPQAGDAGSTTKSGISQGTLDIRNGDTSALANLDRDVTELQQTGLKPIFDEQAIRENMEAGQLASQVGFRAAGDLTDAIAEKLSQESEKALSAHEAAKASGDPQAIAASEAQLASLQQQADIWKEGGVGKAALHAVVAAGVAALGGGDVGQAVQGAVANQAAFRAMTAVLDKLGYGPETGAFDSLLQLASLAVGAVAGGETGASIALGATQNNYLNHAERMEYLGEVLGCAQGDQAACARRDELVALSTKRNEDLKSACEGGRKSNACGTELAKLQTAIDSYGNGNEDKYWEWITTNRSALNDALGQDENLLRNLVTHTSSVDAMWKADCAYLGGCSQQVSASWVMGALLGEDEAQQQKAWESIARHELMRALAKGTGKATGISGRVVDTVTGLAELILKANPAMQASDAVTQAQEAYSYVQEHGYEAWVDNEKQKAANTRSAVWSAFTGYLGDAWDAAKSSIQGGPEWDIFDVYTKGNTEGKVGFDVLTVFVGPEAALAAAMSKAGLAAKAGVKVDNVLGEVNEQLARELAALERIGSNANPIRRVDAYYAGKTDPEVLAKLDMEHITQGHINTSRDIPRGTGVHHEPSMGGQARVTNYTKPPDANGVYEANVQVRDSVTGQWVDKLTPGGKPQVSTFFPQSWSQTRLEYELAEAFKTMKPISDRPGMFISKTKDGIEVVFAQPTKNAPKWRAWPVRNAGGG